MTKATAATQYFSVPTGDGDAPGGNQAVMVPSNRKPLAPVDPERVRRMRVLLVRSLRALRTMKDRQRYEARPQPGPEGFTAQVARTACALCQGHCCKGGGEHAYLDERTLARVRAARPELEARRVIRLYIDRVPADAYQGSCLFHGAQGCTLDRTLRSDVCNNYYCSGLELFLKSAESATSVVVMSGGEGGAPQMSPVLTR